MGIINVDLDDKTKSKIEEIVKKKGFKNINEFINKAIEDEINLQEEISSNKIFEYKLKEEEIINHLPKISSKLKKITNYDKKIEVLVELDDFLIEYKEIIKETCPDMLISILNSL